MQGLVSLFRAVSEAELADVLLIGGFRQDSDGRSYETKLFATAARDAVAWGRDLYARGQFRLIEVRVPGELVERLYHGTMDARPVVAVYPELLAEFNAAAEITVVRDTPSGGG